MATFVKRGDRITAQVRYKGISVAQTFKGKTGASAWATRVEAAIDRGEWPDRSLVPPHLMGKWFPDDPAEKPLDDARPHVGWTVEQALTYYDTMVTETKKGWKAERDRIAVWKTRPIAKLKLVDPTLTDELQRHIEARKLKVANNTIRNETFLLSAVFTLAAKPNVGGEFVHGWGLTDVTNPIDHCILPPPPRPRHRRLEEGQSGQASEEERMRTALLAGSRGVEMVALFDVLLETAMRLSEALGVRRGQLKRSASGRYIVLEDTKNGTSRDVFLSTRAVAALDAHLAARQAGGREDRVFKLIVPQVEYRWKKARKAAGITGLKLHDLRHEGLSRMAGMGLTIGELQRQSGHRTAQILLTYVNAKHEEMAKKLG